MDKNENYIKAAIALAVIFVVWLILRLRPSHVMNFAGEGDGDIGNFEMPDFSYPYNQASPGIFNYNIIRGNSPFNSVSNVNVNTVGVGELASKYMPMFGLVGVVATSTTPAPPAVIQQATPEPLPVPRYVGGGAARAPAANNNNYWNSVLRRG